MKYPINCQHISKKTAYYDEVIKLHEKATNYLLEFKWCSQIKGSSLYTNIGYVLCIFIFEIDNTASSEDNFLWVIVGDFPPMYLGTHGRNTTIDVLQDYMLLASDWINHVKEAKPVDDCYPFDAVPTIEMAELLEQKITSMKNILIDNIKEIIWER